MKLTPKAQPSPKYFSQNKRSPLPRKTLGLCIDVPEDDEVVEMKQPNTTPNSKSPEAGFFKHGKNSPTAIQYKSLKTKALDLAQRLNQKASSSANGTPKNAAAIAKFK
jgi:hypothetical protein